MKNFSNELVEMTDDELTNVEGGIVLEMTYVFLSSGLAIYGAFMQGYRAGCKCD